MASNSPSRWLGPAALLVTLVAVLLVVATSMGGGSDGEPAAPAGNTTERREAQDGGSTTGRTSTTKDPSERRTYRVRPGDTLQIISERTGVSVEELQQLNPDLDPQALTVGQRLKLKE